MVPPPPAPQAPAPWTVVNAIVLGRHEIPDRCAYAVPVAVNAPETSHVYFDAASLVRSLTLEPTLASLGENQWTVALVLNTSGASVLLHPGVCFTRALAYGTRLTDEHLPPSAVSGVDAVTSSTGEGTQASLSARVKVVDYPPLRSRLLETLHKFRDNIVLPGEPLGTTSLAEHKITLKPGTAPVYIPAYRLPHSQRELVDNQIMEMKEQGIIQDSRSPWNSRTLVSRTKKGWYVKTGN